MAPFSAAGAAGVALLAIDNSVRQGPVWLTMVYVVLTGANVFAGITSK